MKQHDEILQSNPSNVLALQALITDTLANIDIPEELKDHFRVVGSGAMVFYGIIPPVLPGKSERPGDLDLLVTSDIVKAIRDGAVQVGGEPVKYGKDRFRNSIRQVPPAQSPSGLPIDFIYKPGLLPTGVYDSSIKASKDALVTPEGYKIVSLKTIERRLAQIAGGGSLPIIDQQAASDLVAIRHHRLDQTKPKR